MRALLRGRRRREQYAQSASRPTSAPVGFSSPRSQSETSCMR
ncbi:hypothetical protein BLSMQ_3493 [Brevibacterium aurantiacum]|uniref:Uncharacterized protein n=1 Tax=Brevibacterium aurantiacum TaxID=273384 RepID=A0A1D7W816_BREAU|nr:hypothetical protein BLSMQ_3493 [Brevibacterium aurantiacum]